MPIFDYLTPFEDDEPSLPPISNLSSSPAMETPVKPAVEPEDQCFDFSAAWFNHPQNHAASSTKHPISNPPLSASCTPAQDEVTQFLSDNSTHSRAEVNFSPETSRCPHCGCLNPNRVVTQNHFSHCYFNLGHLQEPIEKGHISADALSTERPGLSVVQPPHARLFDLSQDAYDSRATGDEDNNQLEHLTKDLHKPEGEDWQSHPKHKRAEEERHRLSKTAPTQMWSGGTTVSPEMISKMLHLKT
jgi:hypothetical protein